MKLYHGTNHISAQKIIRTGFIYPSNSEEIKNEKDKLLLIGYNNLMNGIYLTNNIKVASAFGGSGGEQEWGIKDDKYQNITCKHFAVVFEFEFLNDEIKELQFGEKTLNYFEINKENKELTGNVINYFTNYNNNKYPYTWEDLMNDNPNKAEILKNKLNPKNINLINLINKVDSFFTPKYIHGIDFVYSNKLDISKIISIKIFYHYNKFIESNIKNLNRDIELITNMKHPDIKWNLINDKFNEPQIFTAKQTKNRLEQFGYNILIKGTPDWNMTSDFEVKFINEKDVLINFNK